MFDGKSLLAHLRRGTDEENMNRCASIPSLLLPPVAAIVVRARAC
jgi:hypothetical protein